MKTSNLRRLEDVWFAMYWGRPIYVLKTSIYVVLKTSNFWRLEDIWFTTSWSEVKKENKFSRSRNFDFACVYFNSFECFNWLEKPLWLINTKFGDITDMFNKYRSRSPKVVCKNGVLDSFAKFTRKHLCQSLLLKR